MAYPNLDYYVQMVSTKWVNDGIDREAIVFAEEFGRYLAKPPGGGAMTTSQIRIAYGEVTRLRLRFNLPLALMIKPKMAYAAKRAHNETSADLAKVISAGIDTVAVAKDKEFTFKNLSYLFEAILAYHKAYGGR